MQTEACGPGLVWRGFHRVLPANHAIHFHDHFREGALDILQLSSTNMDPENGALKVCLPQLTSCFRVHVSN